MKLAWLFVLSALAVAGCTSSPAGSRVDGSGGEAAAPVPFVEVLVIPFPMGRSVGFDTPGAENWAGSFTLPEPFSLLHTNATEVVVTAYWNTTNPLARAFDLRVWEEADDAEGGYRFVAGATGASPLQLSLAIPLSTTEFLVGVTPDNGSAAVDEEVQIVVAATYLTRPSGDAR